MLLFNTPENNRKPYSFLLFSRGIEEIKHLKELDQANYPPVNHHKIFKLLILFSAKNLESGKPYFCLWRLTELTED